MTSKSRLTLMLSFELLGHDAVILRLLGEIGPVLMLSISSFEDHWIDFRTVSDHDLRGVLVGHD